MLHFLFLFQKINKLARKISKYVETWQFPVSFESQRNATGHIIYSDGIQKPMMEALCQTFNCRWVKASEL